MCATSAGSSITCPLRPRIDYIGLSLLGSANIDKDTSNKSQLHVDLVCQIFLSKGFTSHDMLQQTIELAEPHLQAAKIDRAEGLAIGSMYALRLEQ
jgi:hypothetical protein